MTSDFTWNGTGLKYAITMTCDGFDMNTDDWTVTVTRGSKKMVFDLSSTTSYSSVDLLKRVSRLEEIVYNK